MVSSKPTITNRIGKMESIIESMLNSQVESLDRSAKNSKAVADLHESVNRLTATLAQQNTPVEEVATVKAQQHSKPAQIYNYQTSAKTASVVEAVQEQKIGCFEILTALVKQFGTGKNGLTVSAPHIKKDGTIGKSYILNMPRIDENFDLVDKSKSESAQKAQGKALWKAVAFNGYTFTGKYFQAGKGSVFTTYIKGQNEEAMIKFLKGEGVHIPKKDHRISKESNEGKTS
jgi:hypothetical protein